MRIFTCAVLTAAFALIFSNTSKAASYTVSDEQLDLLQRRINHLVDALKSLERDYNTPRKIPDERDRRYFVEDVRRVGIGLKPNGGNFPWIEKVKNGTNPPPPPPVTPGPAPITLTQEFVQSTNYGTYYENDFKEAAMIVGDQCAAWATAIRASTVGTVVTIGCSAAQQTTTPDGKIGAKVSGNVNFSFSKNTGLAAPLKVSGIFAVNTGYATFYKADYAQAVKSAATHCHNWTKGVTSRSKGSFLYVQCSAPKWVKGFDGNIWVEITGDLQVSHPTSVEQPLTLKEQFVKTTNYATFYKGDVEKAGVEAAGECKRWAEQTVANSSATPIVVSCAGPEVIKNSNVDVRFQGTAVFLPLSH